MPTYGAHPPKIFDEILDRMGNLSGKKTVVFTTARFSGGKAREYMNKKVQDARAQLIDQTKFRKLFWIREKQGNKFGKKINSL